MKYLLLVAGLLLAGRSWGQGGYVPVSSGEEFVGVWKVKARCLESLCTNTGTNENHTGSLTAQTWTISQEGQRFTLTSDNKAIAIMKNGRFDGVNLIFEGNNTKDGPSFGVLTYGQRITLKMSGGKLSGSQLMGRDRDFPVCMWRYSIDGTQ